MNFGKLSFADYNYDYHTFQANGYLWGQWVDHCGNVVRTKRIRKL